MNQTHESIELQLADTSLSHIPGMRQMGQIMQKGTDCDQIPGAQGPFGSLSNPVPVNGPIGERKYLAKLRGQTGQPVMFHRKGSNFSPTVSTPVDTFEVVCLDGTQWGEITFSPYHPRRSNLAPDGYTLAPHGSKKRNRSSGGPWHDLFCVRLSQCLTGNHPRRFRWCHG